MGEEMKKFYDLFSGEQDITIIVRKINEIIHELNRN